MFFIWALTLKIKTLAAFTHMHDFVQKTSMGEEGGAEGYNAANDLILWDSTLIC